MEKFYIVNMYYPDSYFTTKFIIGIYESEREAFDKQKEFCGSSYKTGLNNSIIGVNKNRRVITWIKIFIQGTIME